MQFEYKVIILPVEYWKDETRLAAEARLNQLGKEGWELVSSHSESSNKFTHFQFKRTL